MHGRVWLVPPEEIEGADDANTQMLEELSEGSEFDWETSARDLISNYNQGEVLGFVVEVLMSGNEEEPELAPERLGVELLFLKTLVDCLDAAGSK